MSSCPRFLINSHRMKRPEAYRWLCAILFDLKWLIGVLDVCMMWCSMLSLSRQVTKLGVCFCCFKFFSSNGVAYTGVGTSDTGARGYVATSKCSLPSLCLSSTSRTSCRTWLLILSSCKQCRACGLVIRRRIVQGRMVLV